MASIPGHGIAKLICEVRVQPTLPFYQHLFSFGAQLESHFRHWRTDGLGIRFVDAPSRTAININHNRVAFDTDIPSDFEAFKTTFRRVVNPYMKLPHIREVLRVGVRGQYFLGRGFRFEELVVLMEEKLIKMQHGAIAFIPGKINDLMFNVVVDQAFHRVHVIAGPVRRDEVAKWTQPVNYDVGEPPEETLEYPEVAAFLDVDAYTTTKPALRDVEEVSFKALEAIGNTAKSFAGQIFEDRT